MMFIAKTLPRFTKRKVAQKVNFATQSNRQLCENVHFSNGVLQGFPTLEQQFSTRSDIAKCLPFANGLLFFSTLGNVRFQQGATIQTLVESTQKCTFFLSARSGNCFISVDDGTYLFDGVTATKVCNEFFLCFQNFAERIFAVSGSNEVRFSAVNNETEWQTSNGGGYVTLDSTVCALATHNGKLYVLGQNVYLLSTDDSLQNWKVQKYAKCFNLQQASVCAVGNGVVYANDNLFLLKNGSVSKMLPFDGKYSFANAVCCHYGNWYVVCCTNVHTGKNVVLFVDVNDGNYWQYDASATQVLHLDGKLYLVQQNKLYCFSQQSAPPCKWVSLPMDFNSYGQPKCLRSVAVKTASNVALKIYADDCLRVYNVPASNKVQNVAICGVANNFVLELQSDNGLQVEKLQFSAVVATPKEVDYGNQ